MERTNLTQISLTIILSAFGLATFADNGQVHVENNRSLFNGAATYSYSIDVPPGTGGMQPDISLEYNSQNKWGPLGYGWNISGFDHIGRSTQNGVPRYNTLPESVILLDDFDDDILHPAWDVTYKNASGWTYNEDGTKLTVTELSAISTASPIVSLSQPISLSGEFSVDFNISWISSNEDMGYLGLELLDAESLVVVAARFQDLEFNNTGQKFANVIGSSAYYSGAGDLGSSGSAAIEIDRDANGTIRVQWNGQEILSGMNNTVIETAQIRFSGVNAYSFPTPLGTLEVDLIEIEDLTSPVVIRANCKSM